MNFKWRAYTGKRKDVKNSGDGCGMNSSWFLSEEPLSGLTTPTRLGKKQVACFVSRKPGKLQSSATEAIVNNFVPIPTISYPKTVVLRPSGQELLGFLSTYHLLCMH